MGFRCWTLEDLPLARQLWGDLEVTRYFGGPFSEEQIRGRLNLEISRMERHNSQYWPIHLLSDNEFVGCCGMRPYRPEEGIHELGFHLRPKFWGKGLAVEAARAVISYGFDAIGAKGFSAGHHPGNVNSQKVMTRLGFRYSHHELFSVLGTEIPYYLLTREERESEERR